MKNLVLILMLILFFGGIVYADQPHPWWCWNSWTRTRYIYSDPDGPTYTYPTLLDSGEGTATSANPDIILSKSSGTSVEASASSTIGIDAEIVCTTTISVSVGWTTTISVSYPLDFDPGVEYTAELKEKVGHWSGTEKYKDKSTCSFWSECSYIQHYHTGTWNSSKYVGTAIFHTP